MNTFTDFLIAANAAYLYQYWKEDWTWLNAYALVGMLLTRSKEG